MRILEIDHIQLAMPEDGVDRAREFYGEVLGLEEVPRPETISRNVGLWFAAGTVRVHLGVERDFQPSKKAHPAFVVEGATELFANCRARGFGVTEAADLEGFRRAHVYDPFGNRIEIMERA